MYKRIFIKSIYIFILFLFIFIITSCKSDNKELTPIELFKKQLQDSTFESISMGEGKYKYKYYNIIDKNDFIKTKNLKMNVELFQKENTIYNVNSLTGNIDQYMIFKKYDENNIIIEKESFSLFDNTLYLTLCLDNKYQFLKINLTNVELILDIIQKPIINLPINVVINDDPFMSDLSDSDFDNIYILTSESFQYNNQRVYELTKNIISSDEQCTKTKTYNYYLTENFEIIKFSYKERIQNNSTNDFEETIIDIEKCDLITIPNIDNSKYNLYTKEDINQIFIKPDCFSFNKELEINN